VTPVQITHLGLGAATVALADITNVGITFGSPVLRCVNQRRTAMNRWIR